MDRRCSAVEAQGSHKWVEWDDPEETNLDNVEVEMCSVCGLRQLWGGEGRWYEAGYDKRFVGMPSVIGVDVATGADVYLEQTSSE